MHNEQLSLRKNDNFSELWYGPQSFASWQYFLLRKLKLRNTVKLINTNVCQFSID